MEKRKNIKIFGTDYDTPDGTCIRDYIHVSDLADAHVLSLEYLLNTKKTQLLNLGNGKGYSVLEVIDTAGKITGLNIKSENSIRRDGDPPVLVGSSEKVKSLLGWKPKNHSIETIIKTAWEWHKKINKVYQKASILSVGKRQNLN